MELNNFLDQVSQELGIAVTLRPPGKEPESLPPSLLEFYAASDGLALPFVELWPAQRIERSGLPGFLVFGFDGLFSYCLCSLTDSEAPFGLWDHEGGHPPETYLSSLEELLKDAYEEFFRDDDELICTIQILGAEAGVSLVTELYDTGLESGDPPFEVQTRNPSEAIEKVRKLRKRGVDCHLIPVFELD